MDSYIAVGLLCENCYIGLDSIVDIVLNEFNITEAQFKNDRKPEEVKDARHVYHSIAVILKDRDQSDLIRIQNLLLIAPVLTIDQIPSLYSRMSLKKIRTLSGKIQHGTVLYGHETAISLLESDYDFRDKYKRVWERVINFKNIINEERIHISRQDMPMEKKELN